MSLNNYYNEIRSDIAKEFGLEAIGYGQPKPMLPIRIAQRITNKYPSLDNGTRWGTPDPRGVVIAKRYMSLVMGVK
jgi:hypothetical protein